MSGKTQRVLGGKPHAGNDVLVTSSDRQDTALWRVTDDSSSTSPGSEGYRGDEKIPAEDYSPKIRTCSAVPLVLSSALLFAFQFSDCGQS
jgi:hypothetical protein